MTDPKFIEACLERFGRMPTELEIIKLLSEMKGYRFETDSDGTERVFRPDGTLVITATVVTKQ